MREYERFQHLETTKKRLDVHVIFKNQLNKSLSFGHKSPFDSPTPTVCVRLVTQSV